MKKLFLAIISMFVFAGNAHSTLILDISDNGSGTTRWQFSGTGATVTDTFNQGSNGFYGEFFNPSSPINSFGVFNVLSGSGAFKVNSTSYAFSSVNLYSGVGGSVSPRFAGALDKVAGDFLSWSGDIITSANFSFFNLGSYSTSNMLQGGVIDSMLIVNIGPQGQVPEPATLALLSLGLVGIGFSRKKKTL